MEKVSVYVNNANESGSPYYLIMQYIRNISESCFLVNNTVPASVFRFYLDYILKSNRITRFVGSKIYSLIINIRALFFIVLDLMIRKPEKVIICRAIFIGRVLPLTMKFYEKLLNKTIVIWAFDDDIWTSGELSDIEADLLNRYSNKAVTTNKLLAKKILSDELKNKTFMLKPCDGDYTDFVNEMVLLNKMNTYDKNIKLVWVGNSFNLKYLYSIIDNLEEAARILSQKYGKSCELIVISNQDLECNLKYLSLCNVKWSRHVVKDYFAIAHIGLMPLEYSEYSLGKVSLKLVQYLTCGIPSVASFVGYNKEILDGLNGFLVEDDRGWTESIINLATDKVLWKATSRHAKESSTLKFSYDENLKVWKNALE